MMRLARRFLLLVLFALAGCIVNVRRVLVESVPLPLQPVTISTPVRAHLLDGSTILFTTGAEVTSSALSGAGARYDLTLRPLGAVTRVPLDSVAALESIRNGTDAAASLVLSLLGTAVGVALTGVALVAAFGSCPTIYADSAGTLALQAESFSYSIAPLFEMRDVDGLYGRPDANGMVWLELRNEALETHYINHLELLEVRHARKERLLPDEQGRAVLIGNTISPRRARDAAGRDVLAALAAADSSWYATAETRVKHASELNYADHIELTFDVPELRDSVAIVVSLRNSLLNTVLFYDVMLGAAGAQAIDWIGGTLEQIGEAAQMGRWYSGRTGVRVSTWRQGQYEQVARIPDVGPIAPKELALVVPTHGQREIRIRLDFLADSWRINQVALAPDARRAAERAVPVARVEHQRLPDDRAVIAQLREPDGEYFTTYPGTAVRIGFATGAPAEMRDSTTSYLIAAQGYYTEWVRGDWIRRASAPVPFTPGDDALDRTFRKWREVRRDFEREFFSRRVPVR